MEAGDFEGDTASDSSDAQDLEQWTLPDLKVAVVFTSHKSDANDIHA